MGRKKLERLLEERKSLIFMMTKVISRVRKRIKYSQMIRKLTTIAISTRSLRVTLILNMVMSIKILLSESFNMSL